MRTDEHASALKTLRHVNTPTCMHMSFRRRLVSLGTLCKIDTWERRNLLTAQTGSIHAQVDTHIDSYVFHT